MSYLNGQGHGLNQQSSNFAAMQTYIVELTTYINENN